MSKVKVGVVGCGMISDRYVQGMKAFDILDVAVFCDLDKSRAEKSAAAHGGRACSLDEMLRDDNIQIVLNLTTPKAHAPIALQAIAAGKHVYNEKPLGITRAEGLKIMKAASKKGVRVGCAPDTFLGAGHQTARKLVDEGAIGKITAAVAFFQGGGPEGYHPDPFFLFTSGGGPLLDMGPYYLTDLAQLLGPIDRVTAFTSQSRPQRTVQTKGSQFLGQPIPVTIQDHVAAMAQFTSGAIATIILSWANPVSSLPRIVLFGLDGTIDVPDPNGFDGPVKIRRPGGDWQEVPFEHTTGYIRGVGIAEMAHAIQAGRSPRASGEQAMHVLDALDAFNDSARTGKTTVVKQPYDRPTALPTGLSPGRFES